MHVKKKIAMVWTVIMMAALISLLVVGCPKMYRSVMTPPESAISKIGQTYLKYYNKGVRENRNLASYRQNIERELSEYFDTDYQVAPMTLYRWERQRDLLEGRTR